MEAIEKRTKRIFSVDGENPFGKTVLTMPQKERQALLMLYVEGRFRQEEQKQRMLNQACLVQESGSQSVAASVQPLIKRGVF